MTKNKKITDPNDIAKKEIIKLFKKYISNEIKTNINFSKNQSISNEKLSNLKIEKINYSISKLDKEGNEYEYIGADSSFVEQNYLPEVYFNKNEKTNMEYINLPDWTWDIKEEEITNCEFVLMTMADLSADYVRFGLKKECNSIKNKDSLISKLRKGFLKTEAYNFLQKKLISFKENNKSIWQKVKSNSITVNSIMCYGNIIDAYSALKKINEFNCLIKQIVVCKTNSSAYYTIKRFLSEDDIKTNIKIEKKAEKQWREMIDSKKAFTKNFNTKKPVKIVSIDKRKQ